MFVFWKKKKKSRRVVRKIENKKSARTCHNGRPGILLINEKVFVAYLKHAEYFPIYYAKPEFELSQTRFANKRRNFFVRNGREKKFVRLFDFSPSSFFVFKTFKSDDKARAKRGRGAITITLPQGRRRNETVTSTYNRMRSAIKFRYPRMFRDYF